VKWDPEKVAKIKRECDGLISGGGFGCLALLPPLSSYD